MAFNTMKMSPCSDATPPDSLDAISITAPVIPSASPEILETVMFSLSTQNANNVISSGVQSMSNEAWIADVIVKPFMKSI